MAKKKYSRASRAKWGRNQGLFLDFSGVENIVKALDQLDVDATEAARTAVRECADYATGKLNDFMEKHVETGATLAAIIPPSNAQKQGSELRARAGFKRDGKPVTLKNGETAPSTGYVAVLFDVGAPNIAPTSFVYNTFRGSANAQHYTDIINKTYKEALEAAQKRITEE